MILGTISVSGLNPVVDIIKGTMVDIIVIKKKM